jgi:hypothetical protein
VQFVPCSGPHNASFGKREREEITPIIAIGFLSETLTRHPRARSMSLQLSLPRWDPSWTLEQVGRSERKLPVLISHRRLGRGKVTRTALSGTPSPLHSSIPVKDLPCLSILCIKHTKVPKDPREENNLSFSDLIWVPQLGSIWKRCVMRPSK